MNKKCVFILPYFGKFNNYFELFLHSFSYNDSYALLIFSDNSEEYDYPSNVRVIRTTLEEIKKVATRKLGFDVCLDTPYKLCDYKPAYGFLFEEYIEGYEYWGHCDCDILFGNLENILTPLLLQGYDKLFAAGHMTIYKNTYENNRRFMSLHNGIELYKEAFTRPGIYVFDEDCQIKHHNDNNIHSVFLESGAKVYARDLSMNVAAGDAKFIRARYIPEERAVIKQVYEPARYYWSEGELFSLSYNQEEDCLEKQDYLYIHLQSRKMRNKIKENNVKRFEILPDRFVSVISIPSNKHELRTHTIGFPYMFWFDVYWKKIRRELLKSRRK